MPYSAFPVMCVKCSLELVPETNGVVVKELWRGNTQVYKVWEADLVKCPGCGILMIKGFAQSPLAVHHELERFRAALAYASKKTQRGECYDLKEE